MYGIHAVQKKVFEETGLYLSIDTIRRDGAIGLVDAKRNKLNNYRQYDDNDVDKIINISLLRLLGVDRKDIVDIVVKGNNAALAERVQKMTGLVLPKINKRMLGVKNDVSVQQQQKV